MYSHLVQDLVFRNLSHGSIGDLLVAVRDEKVRLQLAHVEMNVPNTVSTIDHTQDPLLPADGSEPLEGEAHTRIANDGIEDSRANHEPDSMLRRSSSL